MLKETAHTVNLNRDKSVMQTTRFCYECSNNKIIKIKRESEKRI